MTIRIVASLTRRLAAACLLSAFAFSSALAGYPERPITLVVPYPPGGAADTLGRILAHHMTKQMPGATFVVENRAGAGTAIGAGAVARAAADGYTLLISSNTTFTLNPALKPSLPYDPLKSFEALGIVGEIPLVLIANAKTPVNSVQELVALAKREPGKLSYGSFGYGTTAHFAGEMFKAAADVDILHVPYNGSSPAMKDLLANQIPIAVDTNVPVVPQVEAGTIKALAVTSARRLPALPNVPTFAEAGYPTVDLTSWIAIVTPRGLPAPVRDTLVKAMAAATQTGKADLEKAGLTVRFEEPSAYDARVGKELPAMRALAQKANMKAP